jgi:hypothetical protein
MGPDRDLVDVCRSATGGRAVGLAIRLTGISPIQGTQISHLTQSSLLFGVRRLLTGAPASCSAPAGQAQPHHSRPRKSEPRNISPKTMKLPVMMPSAAPWMMRAGEK